MFISEDTMTPERVETSDGDSGFSDASVASAPGRHLTTHSSDRAKIRRTKPNCNKCKNHKAVKALSGHKRYCPYQHCSCELCVLTDERRRVMAAQTRQKRAQVQDELNGLPLEMRAPVLPPPATETALASPTATSPPSRAPTMVYDSKISRKAKKPAEEIETAVDSAQRLVCEFGVEYTVVPFALALLRRVGSYKLVSKIIIDIQEALLEKTRLTASLVHDRPPIFAHGPNYVPEAPEAHANSLPFTIPSYNPHACGAIPLIHQRNVQKNYPGDNKNNLIVIDCSKKMSDDKESSMEAASPGNSSGALPPRNNPNCGKCRNHGIIAKLRGHKQGCKFRDCECSCCILTVQRRVVMAAQNAHMRRRKMDERSSVDVVRVTPPPAIGERILEMPPLSRTPPANPEPGPHHSSHRISDLEEHSYAANELIKMFSLEMNALPFVYGILGVAGDMRTAIDMVSEANKELMVNPPKINGHPVASAFTRHRSADPRLQMGVLSLVKPRHDGCSRGSNGMFTRNQTPSPPPL